MRVFAFGWVLLVGLLTGCASNQTPYDYSALRAAKPASILVLPPLNQSPEVKATNSVWAQTVAPLAESGYYVMPITLVAQTFQENGLSNPADVHQVDPAKLRQFFGADAALYLNVGKYGTSYQIIGSETVVTLQGRLVDLRSGNLLWRDRPPHRAQNNSSLPAAAWLACWSAPW